METGSNGVKSLGEVEVVAKAERRRFTAEYKLKVLRGADHCEQAGEIGALLRREGLYWSNLITWRKQRERGELAGLSARKRGPKRRENNLLTERVRELERETCRLKRRRSGPRGSWSCKKKSRSFWGSNWERAPRQTDGNGQRREGLVFSPIDLRGAGNGAGQFLPMATSKSRGCHRTVSSSGVIGKGTARRAGGS